MRPYLKWRLIISAGVICLFIAKHFYNVYQEHQMMDSFVTARLSGPLEIPLDCSPLGQLQVTVFPSDKSPDLSEQNLPIIVKRWPELWPNAYQALEKEAEADAGGHLEEKTKMEVDLPDDLLSNNPEWSIHVDTARGSYAARMKGMTVTSTSIDN